jgi:hypothetical protein
MIPPPTGPPIIPSNDPLKLYFRYRTLGGDVSLSNSAIELTTAVAFKHRGVETKLVVPGGPRWIAAGIDQA